MKTSDKSQLTSRLPPEEPMRKPTAENASKCISRFGVLETDSTASKAFIILFYFYDFLSCELESPDNG